MSSPAINSYFSTPLLINHVGQSLLTVPYSHSDSATLSVLSKLLTTGFLHREIREKNGAYGGGASFSALSGVFNFMSYRDPNFSNTLSAFSSSVDWVLSNQFSDRVLALFFSLSSFLHPPDVSILLYRSWKRPNCRSSLVSIARWNQAPAAASSSRMESRQK